MRNDCLKTAALFGPKWCSLEDISARDIIYTPRQTV